MPSGAFDAARALAVSQRFAGDSPVGETVHRGVSAAALGRISQENLRVSPLMTPALWEDTLNVCEQLGLPDESVLAFVYAGPEFQASCGATSDGQCIVRLSSGLVSSLESRELRFVIGHEIGHFLLDHVHEGQDLDSVAGAMLSRSREISADRLGLLACGSLEAGFTALLKTASGLAAPHLRLHFASYLDQIRGAGADANSVMSTHPSIAVRCRALLWYSMNLDESAGAWRALRREDIEQIDARILDDLEKFSDGAARAFIETSTRTLELWIAATVIVETGRFSRAHQDAYRELFGEDDTRRMSAFLAEHGANDVLAVVREKVESAARDLATLVPAEHERIRQLAEDKLRIAFRA